MGTGKLQRCLNLFPLNARVQENRQIDKVREARREVGTSSEKVTAGSAAKSGRSGPAKCSSLTGLPQARGTILRLVRRLDPVPTCGINVNDDDWLLPRRGDVPDWLPEGT